MRLHCGRTRQLLARHLGLALLDGKAEIHLLFERVHLRHLHGKLVAETDYPARAAADQVAPHFVEHIKIVLHRATTARARSSPGPVTSTKKPKFRTSVTSAGYFIGSPDASCAFKNANSFTSLLSRSASAELRSVTEICSAISLSAPILRRIFVKQRAMHHEVSVAADGRGEVRVFFLGQAVMAERLDRSNTPA